MKGYSTGEFHNKHGQIIWLFFFLFQKFKRVAHAEKHNSLNGEDHEWIIKILWLLVWNDMVLLCVFLEIAKNRHWIDVMVKMHVGFILDMLLHEGIIFFLERLPGSSLSLYEIFVIIDHQTFVILHDLWSFFFLLIIIIFNPKAHIPFLCTRSPFSFCLKLRKWLWSLILISFIIIIKFDNFDLSVIFTSRYPDFLDCCENIFELLYDLRIFHNQKYRHNLIVYRLYESCDNLNLEPYFGKSILFHEFLIFLYISEDSISHSNDLNYIINDLPKHYPLPR